MESSSTFRTKSKVSKTSHESGICDYKYWTYGFRISWPCKKPVCCWTVSRPVQTNSKPAERDPTQQACSTLQLLAAFLSGIRNLWAKSLRSPKAVQPIPLPQPYPVLDRFSNRMGTSFDDSVCTVNNRLGLGLQRRRVSSRKWFSSSKSQDDAEIMYVLKYLLSPRRSPAFQPGYG